MKCVDLLTKLINIEIMFSDTTKHAIIAVPDRSARVATACMMNKICLQNVDVHANFAVLTLKQRNRRADSSTYLLKNQT